MFAVLLLTLILLASDADAHKPSQLEEIPHQIQPIASLVGYSETSMENISLHTQSTRKVTYKKDRQVGDQHLNKPAPLRVHQLAISAYTSRVRETDSTPFITASGSRVRWGIVASNKFPMGTRLRLPDLFGSEVFVVEDCMASRYKDRVDIWMPNLIPAQKFGIKDARVEVVEYGKRRVCRS